jgi:hypothetical protein
MKKCYLILKVTVLLMLAHVATGFGATTLASGDMAIVGVNRLVSASSPFQTVELAIVALRDIDAGTVVYISDYGYSSSAGGGFTTTSNTANEGAVTWTTSAITKGTVFLLKINAGGTASGLSGTVSVSGWTSNSSSPNASPVSVAGDNWFIYQGTSATVPSTFVFGWMSHGNAAIGVVNGWLNSGTQTINVISSELPAGLVNGTSAISLSWPAANGGNHGDNNAYKGATSGTKTSLLGEICNIANWNYSETDNYKLTAASSGVSLLSGAVYFTSFTINVPNNAPTAASVTHSGTLQVGQVLTGTYSYTDVDNNPESGSTYKWYRADDASGTNKAAIASANSITYTLALADLNKFISFEVTPNDGTTAGTAVESVFRGPVNANVLPVELQSFEAKLELNSVKLSWKTSAEQSNKGYEIYRHGDGEAKQLLVKVAPKASRDYFVIDEKPLEGNNYYTLSQIDQDGKINELGQKVIRFSFDNEKLLISPNPVKSIAKISFPADQYKQLRLISTHGKLIKLVNLLPHQTTIELDLSACSNGVYVLSLSGNGVTDTQKLIKK